jgi:hypothetical protein
MCPLGGESNDIGTQYSRRVWAWIVTTSGDNSIFLGGLKGQWHTLSRWLTKVEIKVRLFVAA